MDQADLLRIYHVKLRRNVYTDPCHVLANISTHVTCRLSLTPAHLSPSVRYQHSALWVELFTVPCSCTTHACLPGYTFSAGNILFWKIINLIIIFYEHILHISLIIYSMLSFKMPLYCHLWVSVCAFYFSLIQQFFNYSRMCMDIDHFIALPQWMSRLTRISRHFTRSLSWQWADQS